MKYWIIAIFVVAEIQIILGFSSQPEQIILWNYSLMLPFLLYVFIQDYVAPKLNQPMIKPLFYSISFFAVFILMMQGILAYNTSKSYIYSDPDWQDILWWIKNNLNSTDVVLAPLNISRDIIIETKSYSYDCPAFNSLSTHKELMLRYINVNKIYNLSLTRIASDEYDDWYVSGTRVFTEEPEIPMWEYLTDTSYRIYLSKDKTKEYEKELRNLYFSLLEDKEKIENINYKLDYIIFDKRQSRVSSSGQVIYQNSKYLLVTKKN